MICPKPPHVFRFMFQNIQGLPVNPRSHKHTQIGDAFKETEADIYGMAEINLNFKNLGPSAQWHERFQGLRRNHSIHSFNQHDSSTSRRLFGGTAQIAMGACSHRALASGTDPSGLGRWVWSVFAGRNQTKLRVVTGYRPNPDSSDATGSVYSQHERYLRSCKDDRNPRRAFIKDLQKALQGWIHAGDLVIIGLDANDNVRTGDVNAMLRSLGLADVHHANHPHLATVATCNKNSQGIPVDGIWASPSLECLAAGYFGFGELVIGKTDHRMLWADFSYESVFGFQPTPSTYKQPQRLTLDDPRVVRRYNKVLKAEHNRLHLRSRAFSLQTSIPTGLQPNHCQEYENLAHLDMCARQHASKKCRKLRMGGVQFSDTLKKARGEIDMWDLLQRKREGIKASTKKIRRLMRLTDNMTAFQASPEAICRNRSRAMTKYKKIKKNSKEMREAFGNRLMQARAKAKKTTVEVQRKQLSQAFGQRALAQRVRRITGVPRNTMRCVNAPTDTGHRTDLYDRAAIEQACMDEGTRRFSQTNTTPLMHSSFTERVGYHAELSGADDILAGTFVPDPTLDPYAAKFIKQLKMQEAVHGQELHKAISTASYQESWRRMRPHTSCSPSGPAFVDYIAGSQDDDIADFDATMANIPYASGYTPKAWTQMTDVLIPKKSHSSLVEKLRIIVLFHSMFNMNNKRIGREMVANAERLQQIPWEVYGGRKKHRAIECAANKVLTMDIARLEHRSMALCSNDAKSCYDRILHAIASICMRRVGVPKETCQMMFGTLAQVDHYVRTNFGDSSNSYACVEIPFQGVYQGNGAGPGIWLLVSIPIINMLKAAGFGFKVTNVLSHEQFSFVCYAFVDDTDLVHSSSAPLSYDTDVDEQVQVLVQEMQEVVDTWEGGLRASGGALVPSKSYWYLIHFQFKNNRWNYASIGDTPGDLTIRDVSGIVRVPLERLEVSDARETLGVFIAMDGNQEQQTQELRMKANRWADRVRSGRLSHAEAWFSLNGCILKSLEYPLMATSLSEHQCNLIMQPILDAALSALGIARNLSRVVVYGPRRYQGVGVPNLWKLQGILKLWVAIAHGDAPTITGCSLRAVSSLHTIELGLPGSFTQQDYEAFGHLATDSWLKNLWVFCQATNIQLEPSSDSLQPAREHDEFLMVQFYKFGYRKLELAQLNMCRLWCHAIRVSDIATGDGLRLHPLAWYGFPPDDAGIDVQWPIQGHPTQKCWTLWQIALRKCFLYAHLDQHDLRRPLGRWLRPTPLTWRWLYSPSEDRVYSQEPDSTYTVFTVIPRQRRLRSPKYSSSMTTSTVPQDAQRTTVSEQATFVWCHGSSGFLPGPSPSPTVATAVSHDDQWAIRSLDIPDNGSCLAQAISDGTAIALCDGSYKAQFGTAGFVLQSNTTSRHQRIIGANVTPGHPEEQNPYRAEVAGIFAIVVVVDAIVHTHKLTHGSIELGCDCESGLTAVFDHEYDTPNQPHHDLIHEIRRKIAASPLVWTSRHVRGHQDKHISYHLLDPWSQLNVEMDGLAKAYWNDTHADVAPFYPKHSFGWSLWIEGRKLSTWDRTALYNHANSVDILAHWSHRRKIPADLIRSIDWEASEEAIKKLGLNRTLWIPKWLAGFAPVGKVMQRYQFQEHAECPRCSAFEDTAHVLLCEAPRALSQWEASLSNLTLWMTTARTMPDIKHAILHQLTAWKTSRTPPTPTYAWPGINDLVLAQGRVGWRAFLEGGVLQEWAGKQQEYYTWLQKKNTGRRWTTNLIKKMWEISWDMWEHRNDELLNPLSPASLREHIRLDSLIRTEYSKPRRFLVKDQRWFKRTHEVLATEPLEYKKQWLESVTLARARYKRRHRHDLRSERAAMHRYLHPRRPNTRALSRTAAISPSTTP